MTRDQILMMGLKSLLRDEEAVCSLTSLELGQVCDTLRRIEQDLGIRLDVKGVYSSMQIECSRDGGHWSASLVFMIFEPFESELRIETHLTKGACDELSRQYHRTVDSSPELIDMSLDIRGSQRGWDEHPTISGCGERRIVANRQVTLYGVTMVNPPMGWRHIKINEGHRGWR